MDSYPWCVNLTSFGELLLWSVPATKWLRCRHRILGRASLSTDQTAKVAGASSVPTRLPIRLSIEEVTLLLSEGILQGLRCTVPISEATTPSEQQLELFHESLDRNTKEMQEIVSVKRRLQATGFYAQLVNGLEVRKQRQLSRDKKNAEDHQAMREVSSSGYSIRQRRKALHQSKKRQKLNRSSEDSDVDEQTPIQDFIPQMNHEFADTQETEEQLISKPPTLENLLHQYSVGRPQPQLNSYKNYRPEDDWKSCVPRHLPRATPQHWERAGEVRLISLPADVKSGGLPAVFHWLLNLMRMKTSTTKVKSSTSFPAYDSDTRQLLRCIVFADLWSKGVYMTTSSVKMGGDFLIYPGDPLLYHASHVVLVTRPDECLPPRQLAARMRLTNSIRKALVLVTVPPILAQMNPTHQVVYTTIQWTNWFSRT